ncbi:hypothetical protein BJ742DRAFT_841981, partial [Cladochytrium replicatum]
MDLATIAYIVCSIAVVAIGMFAMVVSFYSSKSKPTTVDFFLTARSSSPTLSIAGSFYATSLGAWVVFSMPSYVVTAGIVGLVFYALSSGLPIIMIAYVGSVVQKKFPYIISIGDFARWRFGTVMRFYVSLLMLFIMSVGLTAEYTSVGNLFELVLGGQREVPILVVAIVTTIYTAYGGLYVSILTDVVQAVMTVILLVVIYIYVAVTFRPTELPPLNQTLGPNYLGYAAIAVMPISLAAATVFSEAFWQRVWASADDRSLKNGSIIAAVGISLTCFLFGFGGFLSIWAGIPQSDPYGTTAFFDLLKASGDTAPTWIVILVALITVIMNEGSVDSYQTALTNTLSALFLRTLPLWVSRLAVIVINIPIVIVALMRVSVLSLFLIGNVLSTISAIPLLCGLSERLDGYVSEGAALFGVVTGFIGVSGLGWITMGNLADGLNYIFFVSYDWPTFVVGPIASIAGIALYAGGEMIVRKSMGWTYPLPRAHVRMKESMAQVST